MNLDRVNGDARLAGLQRVALVLLALGLGGCPTVYRYGPGEGEPPPSRRGAAPPTRPVHVPPKARGPRIAPGPPVRGDLAAQLGDGSLPSELLAGARRLVGFSFGGEELPRFRAHLERVAGWPGATEPVGTPRPGDLWLGPAGALAVVEGRAASGRWRVIGPHRGGAVSAWEVDGGRFERAVASESAAGRGR